MENFEDLIKGKSEESRQVIAKLVQSLSKDIMAVLDTRKEGMLDVRKMLIISDIVVVV